jgi:hypothetical protein
MAEPVTKTSVLKAIDAEHADWEALVAEVGLERMEDQAFAAGWTFKDIVAHLMGWRMRTVERLEAAARGEPDPPPPWPPNLEEDDEINAWIYEREKNRPLPDVVQTASTSFERLRNAIDALPDEALTDPNWFPWLDGDAIGPYFVDRSFFGHLHDEHEPDIRAWLAAID